MNATIAAPLPALETTPPRIAEILRQYWGFDTLRPLQLDAINASLSKRDSLVVMPTGGGKSLCYQVPPLVANRTDIVVSPLISLMKDQVDALNGNGYPAAALHSGLSLEERRQVMSRMATGDYRLLFVAPERLLTQSFLEIAERLNVRSFAIDEAHCISQWGHDFRPEYSKLAVLKRRFPQASIHAYTATATPRVQQDIVRNLGLQNAKVILGGFDRPNLTYRIIPLSDQMSQIMQVINRHKDEAVIVYCISRKEAEFIAEGLANAGVKAAPYHAGMDNASRARTQEAFAAERLDVVVATVAFGMGIDRSNVRCVIHAGLPKSIEAYQQETGRAGRDGLEAECVLLHSGRDVQRWEFLIQRSSEEAQQAAQTPQEAHHAAEVAVANLELVRQMQRFATSYDCRHASLVRYFGQEYDVENCGACDICIDTPEEVQDGTHIARQILTAVRDLRSSFGAAHVVDVLLGSKGAKIQRLGHDQLEPYGSLRIFHKDSLRDFVGQCVNQGLLQRTPGDMPVLRLTPRGQQVLAGQAEVKLTTRGDTQALPRAAAAISFDYDHSLFDHLRELRKTIAAEQDIAAFVVFSDVTLRELAAVRPSTVDAFRTIRGVGDRKAADYGQRFVAAIRDYCEAKGLSTDQRVVVSAPPRLIGTVAGNAIRERAFDLFDQGTSVADASVELGRTAATVLGYLEEYITNRKPATIEAWVRAADYVRIEKAARQTPGTLLRPVFDALNGTASYDDIRLVMRHAGLR
ncbi:MAG: DNA helicase RecQ [Dehalococcoidia bacterium]